MMTNVRIALNPHWYSKFWIRQFYELWRRHHIALFPFLNRLSPPRCFLFEVDGRSCLIDVSDHKSLQENPADYFLYFKANYDPLYPYPANVHPCVNGTTLTRDNVPPLTEIEYEYDIVWLAGISGGRPHKAALFEALAHLPLKSKLAARMISPEDTQQWGALLKNAGVEVWDNNIPYRQWLKWNKKGKWCVLARGKHDCLSFKMIDYCSIGAAVVADYPPTSVWDVPVERDIHYISLGLSGPLSNDLSKQQVAALRHEYHHKAARLLPLLQDEKLRRRIARSNLQYFHQHIQFGQAAQRLVEVVQNHIKTLAVSTAV